MLTVLIVDDEQIVRIYLKTMIQALHQEFHLVATCKNGEEALEIAAQTPIDIVITDLKMPKCNGIDLIKALNKQSPNTRVLVLSNHSDYELVREAMKLGAQDYVLKIDLTDTILNQALQTIKAKIEQHQQTTVTIKQMKDHHHAARCTFLETWLTEEVSYTVDDFEKYLTRYKLLNQDFIVIKGCLHVNPEHLVEHYFTSIVEEVLGEVSPHLIMLSKTDFIILSFDSKNIELVNTLSERLKKEVLICLNVTLEVQLLDVLSELGQLKVLCDLNNPTDQELSPLISEQVLMTYRQEVQVVIRYIHEHFQERLTLQSLAESVLLNEAYFSRLFKSQTNKTVNHYLNEVRMYRAKRLLHQEELMIKEVARQVGLPDQLYFNRVFKKFYHISPTAYREQVKKIHS